MKRSTTLALLGSGRIARALIQGLLKTHRIAPNNIIVTSQSGTSARALAKEFHVVAAPSNEAAIEAASLVILCTKPAQALPAVTAIQKNLANKLLVSMAAGIRSEDLFQAAGQQARILRAMPNTAVRVGRGTITLSQHISATLEDFLTVKELFSGCAAVEEVAEEKMDAVTALSGSGPAFALLFLESLIEAGAKLNLDPELARSLATNTLEGAAALVSQTKQSSEDLRREITSPNGTTAAGLNVLEKADFKKIIAQAVEAAHRRAQEMAQSK